MPAQSRRRRSTSQPGSGPSPSRGGGRASARGSNSARLADLGQRDRAPIDPGHGGPQAESGGDLDAAFDLVLAGDFDGAKVSAHGAAEAARATGEDDSAAHAGIVWQVAQAFDLAHDAMLDERYEAAKGHASAAGTQLRALIPTGAVETGDVQVALDSAGKTWQLAKTAADKAAKERRGRDAPLVDQHQLPHWNNGAFCGLATLIMLLRANGLEQGAGTGDLDALASQMYVPGQGTSGSHMAGVMRDRGMGDAAYTTTGTRSRLVATLDKGQPVPFGVVLTSGTVTRLEGGSSQRYPSRRVGDVHFRQFGPSGHWVLVTRYEGKPEAPTAFFVNDPDLGGELRCTPEELDRMGAGSGAYWMIHQ